MPLAEAEASGSRSRARRRRWRESRPSPPAFRGGSTPADMPTTRTRSGSQSTSERSQRRRRRKRSFDTVNQSTSERSQRRSFDTVKNRSRIHEDEDEVEEEEAKKRNLGREEEEEEEKKEKEEEMEEQEEVVSSAPSSPLCEPYIPGDGVIYNRIRNPEIYKAFRTEETKFEQKLVGQMKLPTLENFRASTCLSNDQQLLPVRESGTEAVLCAAKFVLGLSSSVGGKPIQRCSGFWIEWDEKNKTGVVLTTAHLIRSNCPSIDHWLGKDEYVPDAKVIVHFRDDNTAEGHLLYHQEHYDLAFFRVRVDQPVQLPSFNDGVKCAQEVFQLGRDESMNLRITHGRVDI